MMSSRKHISRFTRPVLFIILGMICLLTAHSPTYARTGDRIDIDARFGFGGYYKRETPTPVFIDITNNGDLFEGWALADLHLWVPPTYYTNPLLIPPGGTQDVEMECFGCWRRENSIVDVQVLGQNGDPVAIQTLQPWMLGRADTLFVHLGQPSEPLESLFTGINPGYLSMAYYSMFTVTTSIIDPPKIFPVVMEPDELPENFLLMEGVSTLAMRLGTYLDLDEKQRLLLFNYTCHGGNLIIYYDPGIDPVSGWSSDVLLPASSAGRTYNLQTEKLIETCGELFNVETLMEYVPPRAEFKRRGIRGESIEGVEILDDGEGWIDFHNTSGEYESAVWSQPDYYAFIDVTADASGDVIDFEGAYGPGLITKTLGSGHVGFIPFNPFIGGPTAQSEPVMLLGMLGLLDPECPTRKLAVRAPSDLRGSYDSNIQDFFRQGSINGRSVVMRWLDALGPAMIYLLVLPILVLIGKRRGPTILALLIIWSVSFTIFILVSKVTPVTDKVQVNEAALVWCETLPPGESVGGHTSSSLYSSCFSYSAQTSAPHEIVWNYPDAVLDELVSIETWPYGSITIDHRDGIRLPDLRLETITFRSTGIGDRTFVMRRPENEITASGVLTITPTTAHLELDAQLPYQVVASRLMVGSHHSLWIGKNFGPLETSININTDFLNGTEIRRHESLFPDYTETLPEDEGDPDAENTTPELGHTLESMWALATSMPVGRAQFYSVSRVTGRPTQAYLVMATAELPSELSIDRGEVEHHAVSIVVITVPIVYE